MVLWKTVRKSLSVAVVGLAISGVAVGQVAVPDLGNGIADPYAETNANATTKAAAPPVDAAAQANLKANNSIAETPDTQTDGAQPRVDAGARTNAQKINSNVPPKANDGADAQQSLGEESRTTNGVASSNPFGATFDSQTTDRLVIQNLEPNSTASRLGLQAGDRIVSFNGQTYTDVNQFDRDLARLDRNSDVPMIYERNGQRYTQRFRMSAPNNQMTNDDPNSGNQGWNGPTGQASHSVNRPVYGVSSNSGHSGGMHQGQSYVSNTTMSGSSSHFDSACCGDSMQVTQAYSGHYQHRQHHGGRRHRNRCR